MNHCAAEMAPVKDSGREFHWSRPRIVGLVIGVLASPIIFIAASFGHVLTGFFLFCIVCIGLVTSYSLRTRLSTFMRGLIPTTAEKAEPSRVDPS